MDGEGFGRENIRWTLGDRTLTLPELEAATDVRWPLERAAVLTVLKPGGLRVGMHDVSVSVALRASFVPPAFGPWITNSDRKLTLVG